jgi:uncharacterized protein YbjT (DUF2867 family)
MLRHLGVEVVTGDLKDVRSLEAALRGVGTVVSTATGASRRLPGDSLRHVDLHGHRALVDAARRGGIRRFVFTSVSPNLPRSTPLVRYKREIEAAVRGSGMAWVVVQPSAFLESWLCPAAGFDVGGGKAVVLGSGDARVSYVSVRDVARVMAGLADPDSEVSRTYVAVGGPDAVSPREAVRIFEGETGRRFSVFHAPVPIARAAGFVTRPFHAVLSSALGMAAHRAASGDIVAHSGIVERLVGRPTTLRDYARSAARTALTERVRVLLRGAERSRV